MGGLIEIVKREVAKYGAPSYNSETLISLDDEHQVYAVLDVIDAPTPDRVVAVVVARVVDDKVVIEADNTNKPLVEALLQAGIGREQIVLGYAAENHPESIS